MVKKFPISVVMLIVIITIGIAGVLSMNPAQTTSRPVVSGLVQGDTFTYSIKSYSNVYDLNATIPTTFSQFNQTDW